MKGPGNALEVGADVMLAASGGFRKQVTEIVEAEVTAALLDG